MQFDRFLIAPFETGLQTNLKKWLIMDDAFARLQNAYVFRGRVRKRFGGALTGTGYPSMQLAPFYSKVSILLGTTNGAGTLAGTVPGNKFKVGQQFTIGSAIYTVVTAGAVQPILQTVATTTATYSTTNGAFNFVGAPINEDVYFYPSEPIMGLAQYDREAVNNALTFAFDTQFAYTFAGGFWIRSQTGGIPVWHGTDVDFFWTCNWEGLDATLARLDRALFVTNYFVVNPNGPTNANDDPLYYFDNVTGWNVYQPIFLNDGSYVQTARIIVVYHGRLVVLNTIEFIVGNNAYTQYQSRARWSWVGSPFATNAWLEANQTGYGGAGYADAYTTEEIISAQFIKDRLIVFFERSTWELAYTGNQAEPFRWYKINTELGSEATFSSVPFDKEILTIGNTGVHSCTGANVQRIDDKIPDEIFLFKDPDSDTQRIAGIRDFFVEMVYWTYPADSENTVNRFPNQVMVYNYKNPSWSFNDDCITAFGYFEQQTGLTWGDANFTWQEANMTWGSGVISAQFRQVIAGNQQGYIFKVEADNATNAPVMSLTNVSITNATLTLTIIDHTLAPDDYIYIQNASGISGPFNGFIFKVELLLDSNRIIVYNKPIPPDPYVPITGTYTGGGSITRVSVIQLASKQWNPYVGKDKNFYLSKIDFAVERTESGQITVDYAPSAADVSLVFDGGLTDAIMGNNVLETSPYAEAPLEKFQERLWHPVYFQTDGQCIQIFMSLTDTQIRTPDIVFEDFTLEGMILYTMPTSERLQ